MNLQKPNTLDSIVKTPLHNVYTNSLLDNLKDGEHVSLEGEDGSFVFYKGDKNKFGVHSNSAGMTFVNNPMSKEEIEGVLNPILSHSIDFEGKIPSDLLIRLRNIFFNVRKENIGKTFTIEDIFRNISLDSILSELQFEKKIVEVIEHKIAEGLPEYLDNATKILNEQIVSYPENSIIRKKLEDKCKYLESYKKMFSDGKFIEGRKQNISDLEDFLDILESQDEEGTLANQIKKERNRTNKNDFSSEIQSFLNKIYAWDAFAIPYAQCSTSSSTSGFDQSMRAFSEINGWNKGSFEIEKLGEKQKVLMDEKLSFKQKEEAFKETNEEYLTTISFLLGTGHKDLPNTGEYYKSIQEKIDLASFVEMPNSDVYSAVFQKTLLPFYLRALYEEVCGLLGRKTLDKSIHQYIDDLKNPSGFAKITSAFANKDKQINSLKDVEEKIDLLNRKFKDLETQINKFKNKGGDELIKMASEFSILEDFIKIDNARSNLPFKIIEQDRWLDFMRKN